MSQLSELTAAARTDLIPGHTLSPLGLADYGALEEEFARDHLATVGSAADAQSERIARMMVKEAEEKISSGFFNFGARGFDGCCLSARYVPLLLHTSLKIKSPTLSRIEAAKLLTPENEASIQMAVLALVGIRPVAKKAQAATGSQSPSTGEQSPLPSANAA